MRIGIDARLFVKKQYTGIARSVLEDISVWMRKYPENEYYLFSSKPITLPVSIPANWHIIDTPWLIDSGKLWSIFKLPALIKKLKLDIYWGTNFVLPKKVGNTKYVVTVYDLALFKFKDIGAFSNTLRVKLFTKAACRKAERIIAISEATANDIVDVFHIKREKITMSYCGGLPTGNTQIKYATEKVNRQLVFDHPFFLFISTIEPRKNIISIVRAFEDYKERTRADTKLVLAGKRGWKCDDIYNTIETSKFSEDIVMPGFISDDDKDYLLSHASAFVYPSLYEGFGIPILEAFAYHLPVITARVSSMPEVAQDAAYYIDDPVDIEALSKLYESVLAISDDERATLEMKMEKQLAKFSWEKNAEEIMEIFKELV